MISPDPTRRDFLHASGSWMGGAWLAALLPDIQAAAVWARDAGRRQLAFETLTAAEAAELEAVAERILPALDGAPGARELGVVRFMDRALGTFWSFALDPVRGGLAELAEAVAEASPGSVSFAALPVPAQIRVLEGMQDGGFFFQVRMLTLMGAFSHPDHGGNRDGAGFALLGFQDAGAWQPPFGWYDAAARGQGGLPDAGAAGHGHERGPAGRPHPGAGPGGPEGDR